MEPTIGIESKGKRSGGERISPVTGDTLRAWYQASRAPFFVATLIPLTLGGVIAHAE